MAAKPGGAKNQPSRRKAATPAPQPGSEPPLSRQRIITTAVELLDAEGIAALSMRRLADRLGAGAMSLYWHVESKDIVFDLALDQVLAYRPPTPAAGTDWRGEIIHALEDWRVTMLRHPWSAALLPGRTLGPNTLARLELLGTILSRAGVTDADLNVAIWSLWNHVMGATLTRTSFHRPANAVTAPEQPVSTQSERYPTITRTQLLRDDDWDGTFRKGLDVLLDGLTAARQENHNPSSQQGPGPQT